MSKSGSKLVGTLHRMHQPARKPRKRKAVLCGRPCFAKLMNFSVVCCCSGYVLKPLFFIAGSYPALIYLWRSLILLCYHSLFKSQLNRLQHIQNALARAVVAAPRSSNPDHIVKSLHWLKVQERIHYKIISITYKLLQSSSPHYLRELITIQPSRSTRSSSLVTLLYPPIHSRLKVTNRSFRHAATSLWNKLPSAFLAQSLTPVSYTHLTLPTIYSV